MLRASAGNGNAAIGSRGPIGRAWSCRNPFGRYASFDHQRKLCVMGTALGILHRRVCRSQPSLELLIFSNTVPEILRRSRLSRRVGFRPTYQSANLHAHPRLCGAMSFPDHFLSGRGSRQIARGPPVSEPCTPALPLAGNSRLPSIRRSGTRPLHATPCRPPSGVRSASCQQGSPADMPAGTVAAG